MANLYQPELLTFTIVDQDGNPSQTGVVTVKVKFGPGGATPTEVVWTASVPNGITNPSTGTFVYVIPGPSVSTAGPWRGTWTALNNSGAQVATDDFDFGVDGGPFSDYPDEPTVLPVAEARDLVGSSLSDESLGRVISMEEAWLARRIGKLSGEVTQAIWVAPYDADTTLSLMRPTREDGVGLSVMDGSVALDPTDIRVVRRGTAVERVLGWWTATTELQLGPVKVTYTPNDLPEVKLALIDLIRLRLPDPALKSETVEGYSYTRADAPDARRKRIVRSLLLTAGGSGSIRVQSSVKQDRVSSRTWSTWWPYA